MNRKIKKIILIVLILVITCTAAFFYAHVKQSSDITVISKEKFIKNGESISFEFRCKGNKLYGIFTDMVPDNSDEGTLYYELKNSSGEIVVNDSISFGTINTDGNTGFGFNKMKCEKDGTYTITFKAECKEDNGVLFKENGVVRYEYDSIYLMYCLSCGIGKDIKLDIQKVGLINYETTAGTCIYFRL